MKRNGKGHSFYRLRRIGSWLIAASIIFSFFTASPALALTGRGTMQLGLAAHYAWPQMDVDHFEPNTSYGLIFHYWLNRTTNIMVGLEQLAFDVPLEVDGDDEGLFYTTTVLEVGLRYQFMADWWTKPYLEMGVGYQTWALNPKPDFLHSRSGGGIAYFAGGGLSTELGHSFAASLGVRYFYMPMDDKIEREAVSMGADQYKVDKDPLSNVVFLSAGVEIVYRFK